MVVWRWNTEREQCCNNLFGVPPPLLLAETGPQPLCFYIKGPRILSLHPGPERPRYTTLIAQTRAELICERPNFAIQTKSLQNKACIDFVNWWITVHFVLEVIVFIHHLFILSIFILINLEFRVIFNGNDNTASNDLAYLSINGFVIWIYLLLVNSKELDCWICLREWRNKWNKITVTKL